MPKGLSARRVFVADAVHTFHTGAALSLPRAVVVRDGRIEGLADPDARAERADWAGAEIHDLGGATLVPGFFDGHNHQPTAARDVGQVRTAGVTGVEGLRAALAEAAARTPAGEWISTEHPLTISQLATPVLPSAADLDAATPDHPVAVRFGAHTMVLNGRALRESGIAALGSDPAGGVVDRDPRTGAPTGPIREYGALRAVLGRLPALSSDDLVLAMRHTQRDYAAAGITSVRVPGFRPGDLALYQRLLRADGRLANRVAGGPRLDPTSSHEAKLRTIESWEATTGFGSEWLRLDAVKIFVDGGIETALDGTTHLFLGEQELTELVRCAVDRGWSVACHAVTPRAVELALNAYECVLAEAESSSVRTVLSASSVRTAPSPTTPSSPTVRSTPSSPSALSAPSGTRLSIEHGFFATPEQLHRAARLGVWLSTQPSVAHIESALIRQSLSADALARAFPLRSALAAGVSCALGSDWNATPGTPVRPFSPLESVRAAVHRNGADGLPFGADEAVTVAAAFHLHTRAPADLAGFRHVGGLWPGAWADLVALSADPLTDLASAEVRAVAVGGELLPG